MNDAVDLNPAVEKDAKASVMTGTGSGSEWLARYSSSLMGVFGTPQRVLVRGAGCLVWDADGKEYLDLLGGIAVNALGHAHPFVTSVISSQLATLEPLQADEHGAVVSIDAPVEHIVAEARNRWADAAKSDTL